MEYAWDTDNDGLFGADDTDGTPWSSPGDVVGEVAHVDFDQWQAGTAHSIHVRATDSCGLTSTDTTTVEVVDGTEPFVSVDGMINDGEYVADGDTVSGSLILHVRTNGPDHVAVYGPSEKIWHVDMAEIT